MKIIEDQNACIREMEQNVDLLTKWKDEVKAPKIKIAHKKKAIPKHLSLVHKAHLKDLCGLRMKSDGKPGGDCLSSCTTIHLSHTKDKYERRRVNRRINHHIADNVDTYYVNKIGLQYSETVGVGSAARQVTCNTREELLAFLRSEDSLCAYSNYQELLAICNMLNIKIYVFTYGIGGVESSWSWRTVSPDPERAKHSDFAPGTVPDMYLYNSDDCHYNLLVEDNSRLAVLGLVSLGEGKEMEGKEAAMKKVGEKEVNKIEVGNKEKEVGEMGEIYKEHTKERVEEQWKTVQIMMKTTMFHKINVINARKSSLKKTEFEQHIKTKHSRQWNCDTCAFQATTRTILMNHCQKAQGHQPAKQNQRKGQTGVLECYTCKSEFRSYHDLMSHRKDEHPSHKRCRYFIKGECNFTAAECWYLHESMADNQNPYDEGAEKCFVCKKNFPTKFDVMQHKKNKHTAKTQVSTPTNNVWAKPQPNIQNQDFCPPQTSMPPDQALMMAINMLNQKMETIDSMSQRLQAMESKMFPSQF